MHSEEPREDGGGCVYPTSLRRPVVHRLLAPIDELEEEEEKGFDMTATATTFVTSNGVEPGNDQATPPNTDTVVALSTLTCDSGGDALTVSKHPVLEILPEAGVSQFIPQAFLPLTTDATPRRVGPLPTVLPIFGFRHAKQCWQP